MLFRTILGAVLGVSLASPVLAGANRWTSGGPEGGQILAVAVTPGNPMSAWVGTTQGLWSTSDGGSTWIPRPLPISPGSRVAALAVDPVQTQTVYVGTSQEGLLKSTDGGATWTARNAGLTWLSIVSIAIDPTNPAKVYVATVFERLSATGGLYVSSDGGGSWTSILRGFVTSVAIDAPHGILYAGRANIFGVNGGVDRSLDGGATWSTRLSADVHALALDPAAPDHVFAGTQGAGVFFSTDSGGSWNGLNAGLGNLNVAALVAAPGGVLYAATLGGGVFQKSGAADWTAVNSGLTGDSLLVTALALDSSAPSRLLAGTAVNGVFRSIDTAASWQPANTGINSLAAVAVAIDPSNPSTLYSGSFTLSDLVVFRSLDGGTSWSLRSTGLSNASLRGIVVDPADSTHILAATDHGVFSSTTSGASWLQNSYVPNDTASVAASPTSPTTLCAGLNSSGPGIYCSSDGGSVWTPSTTPLPPFERSVRWIAPDLSSPSRLYAAVVDTNFMTGGQGGGVLKSIDAGASWTFTGLVGKNVFSVAVDPSNPLILYAASDQGVFASGDGAATWSPLGLVAVNTIAVNPTDPAMLVAGTSGQGVFQSRDRGKSWAPMNDGLANLDIRAVVIDPSGTRFHAATYGRGVFDYEIHPASFYAVTPCRAVDTRGAPGPAGSPSLAAEQTRVFPIAGGCGVPSTATSVAVNVTVTAAAAQGHLRVFAEGIAMPSTSTINYSPGRTRANNAVVSLGPGGIAVYCRQDSGTVDLIVDVVGYFQ